MTSEEKSSSLPFSLGHYSLIMISLCGPGTFVWQEIRPSAYVLALKKPHPNPTKNRKTPRHKTATTTKHTKKPDQPNEKTIGSNYLAVLITIVGNGL